MSLCKENQAENASLSQLGTVTTRNNALAMISPSKDIIVNRSDIFTDQH